MEKEARKLEKIQRKQEKKEQKSFNKFNKYAIQLPTTLPDNITNIYLDGNNMLFVLNVIRSRVLRKSVASAENLLQFMASKWAQVNNKKITHVTLIFDETNKNSKQDTLFVCSARPVFRTSDDALISWIQQTPPDQIKQTVVFTSDGALGAKLIELGAQVFKSKCWFSIVASSLGRKPEETLDMWAFRWIAENANDN